MTPYLTVNGIGASLTADELTAVLTHALLLDPGKRETAAGWGAREARREVRLMLGALAARYSVERMQRQVSDPATREASQLAKALAALLLPPPTPPAAAKRAEEGAQQA